MSIRLPNTDNYIQADIDLGLFIKDRESETELFGWYDGTYIAIKKEAV